MNVLIYSISVWFFFYLFNYSDIAAKFRDWVVGHMAKPFDYLVQCAFCTTFYITALAAIKFPYWYILVAPVINLFIDMSYRNLKKNAGND